MPHNIVRSLFLISSHKEIIQISGGIKEAAGLGVPRREGQYGGREAIRADVTATGKITLTGHSKIK